MSKVSCARVIRLKEVSIEILIGELVIEERTTPAGERAASK